MFRGTATALITPFTQDGIDYEGVEKLTEYADCRILSGKAAVPVLDRTMVRRLLARQLAVRPLGENTVPELARLILDAFAEERYKGLLLKSVESEVERLLEGARLRILNGQLQLEFPEEASTG